MCGYEHGAAHALLTVDAHTCVLQGDSPGSSSKQEAGEVRVHCVLMSMACLRALALVLSVHAELTPVHPHANTLLHR